MNILESLSCFVGFTSNSSYFFAILNGMFYLTICLKYLFLVYGMQFIFLYNVYLVNLLMSLIIFFRYLYKALLKPVCHGDNNSVSGKQGQKDGYPRPRFM